MVPMDRNLLDVAVAAWNGCASGSWDEAVDAIVDDLKQQMSTSRLPLRLLLLLATPDWCDPSRPISNLLLDRLAESPDGEPALIGASSPRIFVSVPHTKGSRRDRILCGFAVAAFCSENLWAHVGNLVGPFEMDKPRRESELTRLVMELEQARLSHLGLRPSCSVALFGFMPGPYVDKVTGQRTFLDHELCSDLLSAFGDRMAFYGGSAANDLVAPTRGFQFSGRQCLESSLVASLMEFDYRIGTAMGHGLEVEHQVTMAVDQLLGSELSGYVAEVLDGRPAATRLRQVMEEVPFSQPRPTFGTDRGEAPHVVVPVDSPETWNGPVRFNRRIHRGDSLSVLNGSSAQLEAESIRVLRLACQRALGSSRQSPRLVLGIGCCGRFSKFEKECANGWWRAAETLADNAGDSAPTLIGLFAGEHGKDDRLRNRSDNFSLWIGCLTGIPTPRAAAALLQRDLISAGNVLIRAAGVRQVCRTAVRLAEALGATGGQIALCDEESMKILATPHGYAHSRRASGIDFASARMRTIRDMPKPGLRYDLDPIWRAWLVPLSSQRLTSPEERLSDDTDLLTVITANRIAIFVPDSRDRRFHCDPAAVADAKLTAQFAMPLLGRRGRVVATLQLAFPEGTFLDRDTIGLWIGYGQKVAASLERALEYEEKEAIHALSKLVSDRSGSEAPPSPFPEYDIVAFLRCLKAILKPDYLHVRLEDDQVKDGRPYRLVTNETGALGTRHARTRQFIGKDDGSMLHAQAGEEIFTTTEEETLKTQVELRRQVNEEPVFETEHLRLLSYRTVANLPLLDAKNAVRGVLVAHSDSGYFFTERSRRVLRFARRALDALIDERRAAFARQRHRDADDQLAARGFLGAKTIHELMHPLVTIKKRIELEVSARQPSQSLVESLGTIGDQTDRMIDVIKARAAGVYLGHNLLPPRELLRAAMADLDPETCAWIAEPLVAPALASARVKTNFWLTTGIASLLENAVDCARDHESKVRVTVDVFSEGTVHLLISNEGPVLSHEDVDRMLEAGHSTKDSAHLGLGVPLAEAGIRSVDGELVLRPRQTGGLDAEIMLPLRRITANPSAGAQ